MTPTFQILTGNDQKIYFRLVAANNEIILSSEGYNSRQGCLNGIEAVRTNAPYNTRYQTKVASNWKNYFVLHASNGEIIGTSQLYDSAQGCAKGILAVIDAAPKAIIK